jgi:hypothetical protein
LPIGWQRIVFQQVQAIRTAVNVPDVIHLIAELIENATKFAYGEYGAVRWCRVPEPSQVRLAERPLPGEGLATDRLNLPGG